MNQKLMQLQINTLYVGNLPAISPPTHPPSYLEDSLRAMFQQSPGFKRMSFRQKINGPMCFVQYEDVGFATRAIRDLYGNGVVCFSAFDTCVLLFRGMRRALSAIRQARVGG